MSMRNPARQLVTPNLSKNSFDLSNYWRGTTRMGTLTPVAWYDITPNSHYRYKLNYRTKFAPVVFPFDHRIDMQHVVAFITYRQMMPTYSNVYTDWENFIMGDPQSRYANDILPYAAITDTSKANFYRGTLSNHLGLPPLDGCTVHSDGEININVLPHIAYQMIWDEFFRNPWLVERQVGPGSAYTLDITERIWATTDLANLCAFKNVPYDADYFMGALPEAYSGSSSDVELDLDTFGSDSSVDRLHLSKDTNGIALLATSAADTINHALRDGTDEVTFTTDQQQPLVATLEVLELRRAEALTRFLEAENRSGEENYDDWLKVMFGHDVNFAYARPVYLGGGRQAVNVSEVLSTAEVTEFDSDDTLIPQGTQVGHAMVSTGSETINFFAREPGILMVCMVAKPKPAYCGGIEKFWLKTDRTEFYNHHFQGIGDQEIYNAERGYDCTAGADNTGTWAYSTRWEEYKQKYDIITGDYQTDGLDGWHLGKIHDMDVAPTFNSLEIEITPDDDENIRIFADQTGANDEIWLQVYNDMQAILPMHKVDIPK